MMAEEDDGFAVRIGGVNQGPSAKAKLKAKATSEGKNQKPLVVASKIRSSTLRAFNACESTSRTARSSAIECLTDALKDEAERESSEVVVLKNRLRALNLMMGAHINDGLQDLCDGDDDDADMQLLHTHGNDAGKAVYELLQRDAYFKESSSCPDPDQIQILTRMRTVRPLVGLSCCCWLLVLLLLLMMMMMMMMMMMTIIIN